MEKSVQTEEPKVRYLLTGTVCRTVFSWFKSPVESQEGTEETIIYDKLVWKWVTNQGNFINGKPIKNR